MIRFIQREIDKEILKIYKKKGYAILPKLIDEVNIKKLRDAFYKIFDYEYDRDIFPFDRAYDHNKVDKSFIFDFEIPKNERKHLIEKASICVNGISLTISKVTKKGFQIWIIPHTYKETNLSTLKKSSLANIEIDILSKYVRNYFNEKK